MECMKIRTGAYGEDSAGSWRKESKTPSALKECYS